MSIHAPGGDPGPRAGRLPPGPAPPPPRRVPLRVRTPLGASVAALVLAGVAGGLAPAGPPAAGPSQHGSQRATPRRLILCIGDGMGWGALSVAQLELPTATLLSGAERVGAVATGSHSSPVTDSAAAGTALATAHRTRNGWLNLDPETRAPLTTLAEEAHHRGLAVGLVTTSSITHATPAAFYAHVDDRERHDEIARQLVRSDFDFVAGGGRGRFRPGPAGGLRKDNLDLIAELEASGVTVATTLEGAGAAPAGRRLALLYSEDEPPAAGPSRPPLEALVDLALHRLSRDPDGFFLMVEGAQIDWTEHDRDAQALPGELADFDRAVAHARHYAASVPRTAVVVVADHDTGSPTPVESKQAGAPPEIRFLSGDHTALLVPLLVNGAPAAGWARARHLTDLGQAMHEWLLQNAP